MNKINIQISIDEQDVQNVVIPLFDKLLSTILIKKDEQSLKNEKEYTVQEVAKLKRLDPTTVRRHIKNNILKASKCGKSYRITEESLNNYHNE